MTGIETFLLLLATVLGAVVTSALGWLDDKDASGNPLPFDVRKFIPSFVRGIIAAIVVFIASYEGFLGDVTLFTYLGAFLAGGGFDVMVNRGAGIAGIGQKT